VVNPSIVSSKAGVQHLVPEVEAVHDVHRCEPEDVQQLCMMHGHPVKLFKVDSSMSQKRSRILQDPRACQQLQEKREQMSKRRREGIIVVESVEKLGDNEATAMCRSCLQEEETGGFPRARLHCCHSSPHLTSSNLFKECCKVFV